MLNNKGFVISGILYLSLVLFLLFLMITLSQFIGSSYIIGKANEDLIDGVELSAKQVRSMDSCKKNSEGNYISWNNGNKLVQIKSRHGTMYWPLDFDSDAEMNTSGILSNYDKNKNKNIEVTYQKNDSFDNALDAVNNNFYGTVTITDNINGENVTVNLINICGNGNLNNN